MTIPITLNNPIDSNDNDAWAWDKYATELSQKKQQLEVISLLEERKDELSKKLQQEKDQLVILSQLKEETQKIEEELKNLRLLTFLNPTEEQSSKLIKFISKNLTAEKNQPDSEIHRLNLKRDELITKIAKFGEEGHRLQKIKNLKKEIGDIEKEKNDLFVDERTKKAIASFSDWIPNISNLPNEFPYKRNSNLTPNVDTNNNAQIKNWLVSSHSYKNRISILYSFTRLLGKPDPVPLTGIFSDVYILDQPTALKRYALHDLRNDPDLPIRDAKRVKGLELIKNNDKKRHLFVLGKPGAGKTTFLKYLIGEAVESRLNVVPVFIALKEWSDKNRSLMSYLVEQFEICNFPDPQGFVEMLLYSGDALLLFDGLDEVNAEDDKRNNIIRQVSEFVMQHNKARYIVTCRNAAVPDFVFGSNDPFSYVELADFTPEQVKIFTNKWFAANSDVLVKFEMVFYGEANKHLRELANTPLLLTLLCLNFEGTLDFPPNRHEIYSEALEVLLKRWDATRSIKRDAIYHDLSLERKRQLLAHIAYQTFSKGELLLSQDRLCDLILGYFQRLNLRELPDAETILKVIESQHGLFVERAHSIYSFSHLTLHEYFAALYIKNVPTRQNLTQLLTLSHVLDSRWREVMKMLANMLSDGDEWCNIFLSSIEEKISRDTNLIDFAIWAQKKSNGNQKELILYYYLGSIRTKYFAESLAQDRINHVTTTLDRDLDRDLHHIKSINQIRFLDLILNRDRDIKHSHKIIQNKKLLYALNFHYILNDGVSFKDITEEQKLDWGLMLYFFWTHIFTYLIKNEISIGIYLQRYINIFDQIVLYAQQTTSINLYTIFQSINRPEMRWNKDDWDDYHNKLIKILQDECNICHHWPLNQTDDIDILMNYYEATQIFIECFQVANLSPELREQAQTRILNPQVQPIPFVLPPLNRLELLTLFNDKYDFESLTNLVFSLNIKWDNLQGTNLPSKARSLIEYCENRDLMQTLNDMVRGKLFQIT